MAGGRGARPRYYRLMRLLLDTHVLLWCAKSPQRLPAGLRNLLNEPSTIASYSIVSLWEIATKIRIGKLTLGEGFRESLQSVGYPMIALEVSHIDLYQSLPLHHRDPFDRMLIAQAQAERITLVTHDQAFTRYDVDVLPWI